MGGNFAAGEKVFPIYWAISLPVTFALLIWVLREEISKAWPRLMVRRRLIVKEHESDGSESETSDRESDGTNAKRNWRKFLRRRSRGARADEEKVIESHSIGERYSQTARLDSTIPAGSGPLEMTRPNSI